MSPQDNASVTHTPSLLESLLTLCRPHQYVKNLFVFMPLFFGGNVTDTTLLLNSLVVFVGFSITASAVYVLNDLKDCEEDKKHPKKKHRPIASGLISVSIARWLIVILSAMGIALTLSVSLSSAMILLFYFLMNIAYSFSLKHIAILDVTIIAVGFVLRLFVGAYATDTPLSMWIIIMTFLLALFMALAKRRDDVLLYMNTGKKMRKVIDGYNLQLIDSSMFIMASVVIVAYIQYTTSAAVVARMHSDHLYLTSLFVILGILRYLQITLVEEDSSSPTKIALKDRFMQLSILSWLIAYAWIIYL